MAVAAALIALPGCKKKEDETNKVDAPPPPGGASADLVATNIGTGLGLPADLAPTSTVWERVFVLDGDTAVIAGRALDQAIALRTTDKGRSWSALSAEADAWQAWSATAAGDVILASGPFKRQAGPLKPVESARVWFAPRSGELSEPAPLFPSDTTQGALGRGLGAPAALSAELASLLLTQGRRALLAFAAPAGKALPAPTAATASIVASPYGRPPQLLSIAAGAVEVRPWPAPGEAVERGSPIPGLRATGAVQTALDEGPECDAGAWSFKRVAPAPSQPMVVGVSDSRAFAFALPPHGRPSGAKAAAPSFGCSTHALVVETYDATKKEPQLVRCTLDGKCASPKSLPFQIWPEEHERRILSTTTEKGVVAVMGARAGARWGTYLAQSADEGATFELPRVIGEGKTENGRYELGALIGMPDRVLLLLSAEQTGTGKRRWYVLASDDGGSNWGPP